MRHWFHASLVLVIASAAHGCAHHGRRGGGQSSATPLEAVLPPTRVQPLPLDDSLVGTLSDVEGVLQPSFRHPAEYRALSPEQCQCLAVKASSEGNSLAAERRALLATASHHGLTQEERLKVQVLWASELEARNRSAAAALTTYYHIAQAEANRPILARSLHELDDALANVARMRAQGMQIPFDDGELERQRLGVLDRQLKLISQLDQLNAELVQRLGLSTAEVRPRIWPTADFTVNVAPTDIDLAVGVGISSRPELQLLRSLKSSLKARNVAVTRDVVGGAGALIGSQSKFTGMVSLLRVRELIGQCCSNHRELPTRQRQLAEYYDRRQREVTTEIQQAVLEVESSLRRIAVEKQAVIAWRTEIDRLAKKSQIDQATFLDSSRARLKRLQAESDEIEQIIAWKIALVKVKEGQGMLVNECLANGCKFLDYPVVHETGGGPLSELIVPEDPLPEPEGNESDGPSLSPPAAEAEGILPPMLPRPPTSRRSIVMRLLQPKEDDAESAPPDVAVEPPSPPEDRTGSAPE